MHSADFLIEHATAIATCAAPAPRRGRGQRDISLVENACIASTAGRIVYVGDQSGVGRSVTLEPNATRIDASGCVVVPGFVDPHTHVVYAGDRRQELQRRLAGATYAEIAAEGGGILSTVAATRTAAEQELVTGARARLDEMLACGTTTCEAKSGYGLTTDAELKLLRVIRTLGREHDIDIVPTFMGAHEVPPEFRHRRADYVTLVTDEMIPRIAEEGLATYCDVFCDEGAFTHEEAAAILSAGRRYGLGSRVHAEELAPSGGAMVAARAGARSADHLVFVNEEGAAALATANVCAVLLPTAAFYLKLGRFAPARMLIGHDVPVALATDINPGGGFSPSMPFAMALACFEMGMTLEEALVAATLNAAWALDMADIVGSLQSGRLMDAVLVNGDLIELIRVGTAAIRMVIKSGRVVWSQP